MINGTNSTNLVAIGKIDGDHLAPHGNYMNNIGRRSGQLQTNSETTLGSLSFVFGPLY